MSESSRVELVEEKIIGYHVQELISYYLREFDVITVNARNMN